MERESIYKLYEGEAQDGEHIHPYIGENYLSHTSLGLRIMAVGINSYVSKEDWSKLSSDWYWKWAQEDKGRFFKRVNSDVSLLGKHLRNRSEYFKEKEFDLSRSLYLTNAVSSFLTEDAGKRSQDVPNIFIKEGADRWRRELSVLAINKAFPDVIIVFSEVFWSYAWKTFGTQEGMNACENFKVSEYLFNEGACKHYLNKIIVNIEGEEQPLLLVRFHHPSAMNRTRTPEWLFDQPEFDAMLPSIA